MSEFLEKARENIKKKGLPIVEDEKTRLPLYISMRELSLKYQLGITRIQRFFLGLSEGKVYATQCKKCGEKFFPPRADCSKCLNSDMSWIPINGKGELLTYTVINVKPPSFSHYKDYIVGIAQLEEGIKVLAWLNVNDPKQLKPKMKVRLATTKREPEGYITYELVPAE